MNLLMSIREEHRRQRSHNRFEVIGFRMGRDRSRRPVEGRLPGHSALAGCRQSPVPCRRCTVDQGVHTAHLEVPVTGIRKYVRGVPNPPPVTRLPEMPPYGRSNGATIGRLKSTGNPLATGFATARSWNGRSAGESRSAKWASTVAMVWCSTRRTCRDGLLDESASLSDVRTESGCSRVARPDLHWAVWPNVVCHDWAVFATSCSTRVVRGGNGRRQPASSSGLADGLSMPDSRNRR